MAFGMPRYLSLLITVEDNARKNLFTRGHVSTVVQQCYAVYVARRPCVGDVLADGAVGTDAAREAKIEDTLRRMGVQGVRDVQAKAQAESKDIGTQIKSIFDVSTGIVAGLFAVLRARDRVLPALASTVCTNREA